jgi:hypothetical protein
MELSDAFTIVSNANYKSRASVAYESIIGANLINPLVARDAVVEVFCGELRVPHLSVVAALYFEVPAFRFHFVHERVQDLGKLWPAFVRATLNVKHQSSLAWDSNRLKKLQSSKSFVIVALKRRIVRRRRPAQHIASLGIEVAERDQYLNMAYILRGNAACIEAIHLEESLDSFGMLQQEHIHFVEDLE